MLLPSISFVSGIMLCHLRRQCHLCSYNNKFLARRRFSTQTSVMASSSRTKSTHQPSLTVLNLDPSSHQHHSQHCMPPPLSAQLISEPTINAAPTSGKIYGLSDIKQYLNLIEAILRSSKSESNSPALRYEHCYTNDDNKDTFFKVIGSVLAKPMLRSKLPMMCYNESRCTRILCFHNALYSHSPHIW